MTTKLTQNQIIAEILRKEILAKSTYIESDLYQIVNTTKEVLKYMEEDTCYSEGDVKISGKDLQDLIKEVEAFDAPNYTKPEYRVKNALLAALTGRDYTIVIHYLAEAYKYNLLNQSINQ